MSVALWRKIEGACLVIELPLARWQLRIYLANPALPMRLLPGDFMPPEGIDINHRECRILFVGDLDFHSVAAIMDQVMRIKETLPILSPPRPVKSAHDKNPVNRIMGIGSWREWPRHIRMDHGQEKVRILSIPTLGFKINHLLNFFFNQGTHIFLS